MMDLQERVQVNFSLLPKQYEALSILRGHKVNEMLYGGGAGGGKSVLGVYWLISNCLNYKNTRWVMGRAVLKTLKETTLNSFIDVCRMVGAKNKTDYRIDLQKNIIYFYDTGSEILLKDLAYYPSDPNFDELGSLEITGAFVDECNQIQERAWEVLKSRIRYKLDENNLIPTIMGSCNPAKNWVYRRFYKPWKTGELQDNMAFVPALVKDNSLISKHYVSNLESISDQNIKSRLLHGDWDYESNPYALCDSTSIRAIFENNIATKDGNKYITADIARFGADRAIIAVWEGWELIEYYSFATSATTEIQQLITTLRRKHKIPTDRCIADEDGVGGGVVDNLGILGFSNNGTPFRNKETGQQENYLNLQCQSGYHLAKIINNRELLISAEMSGDEKDGIILELEQLQSYKVDSDGKLRIKPKVEIKIDIGRSPDWRDVLLMRSYFDYVDTEVKDINWF